MFHMIENDHVVLWGRCLNLIRDNVPETTFKTWFEPIVRLKQLFSKNTGLCETVR